MKKIPAKIKFLLYNLLAAVLIICALGFYVLSQLDNYTRHGYSIAVPAFYHMTFEEAQQTAKQAQLRVQIVDSIYDEQAQPGVILEQYPASGAGVKENRLIHLTINAQNPEKVIFPNLQNAAYRQTLQTLEARGFTIGRIEYAPSEFKNLVLGFKQNGQELLPGTRLRKGSTVDIVLGSGSGNNSVLVPSMTGKKLKEAIDIARKAYLNIGEITPDGSISHPASRASAIVYQQYPEAQNRVEAGTPVSLYITLKKEKINALDSLLITE